MGCAMTTVCSVQDFLYRNACARSGVVDDETDDWFRETMAVCDAADLQQSMDDTPAAPSDWTYQTMGLVGLLLSVGWMLR